MLLSTFFSDVTNVNKLISNFLFYLLYLHANVCIKHIFIFKEKHTSKNPHK